jgi:ferredoxin
VAAIAILDRVLLGEPADAVYAARRRGALVVAVSCSDPAETCFCGSMGCGPHATAGFDLALTELAGEAPRFVLECGSERGAGLASRLGATPAADADLEAAVLVHARAEAALTRQLELPGLKQLLEQRYDDPLWDEVARRCLACGNCTLVCPTCFCTAIDDVTDLTGREAERRRRWDTCFGTEFSYIHGGSVRTSRASRYRQWLTHKLAAWQDQFGTPGCVGCGRCIAWCPAAIDITAEAAALRQRGGGEEAGR